MRQKLLNIQLEIKAGKTEFNKFGDFHFRKLPVIFEAFKPLAERYNVLMVFDDDIHLIGERLFVVSKCSIQDVETGEIIGTGKGHAEIPKPKAKTDEAQATGIAETYARKRATEALLLLDDGKDSDTETDDKPEIKTGTDEFEEARKFLKQGGNLHQIRKKYKVSEETHKAMLKLNEKDNKKS